MKSKKETIVFDFDGVIHSYTSGWQGADVIPDFPVDGIKEFIDDLRNDGYEVVVVSARCHQKGGIDAIKNWLQTFEINVDAVMAEKPPAKCYIDDRALCFNPNNKKPNEYIEDYLKNTLRAQIDNFEPWTKKKGKLFNIINNDDIENTELQRYIAETSNELRIASQIKRNPEKIAAILDRVREEGFDFVFEYIQRKIEADVIKEGEASKEPKQTCPIVAADAYNLQKLVLLGQLKTYVEMCESQYRFLIKLSALREKIRTGYMRRACDEVCKELRHDHIRTCVGDIVTHTGVNAEAIIEVIQALYDVNLIRIETIDEKEVNDAYKVLWDNEQDLDMLYISSQFASNLLLAIDDTGSIFNYKIRR